MGQYIRVNGDYNIKAGDGAKIILDTGPAISGGEVRVTGNLVVEGDSFNIATTNLTIEDNIISLNVGEIGPGVSLGYSGIQVSRGDTTSITPQNDASLLYDESIDAWIFAHGAAPGPFNFDSSTLKIRSIITNSTTDDGDLTLIGTGTGVIKVFGTTNYEDQITHDDDVPNKKYVDDAILNNPTFQIRAPQSEDTRVIIADRDIVPNGPGTPGSLAFFTASTTYSTYGESAVSVIVDGQLASQFYPNRLELFSLEISSNEITTRASLTNENILIRTQGTGKLQTNYALQLDKIAVTPAYVANHVLIHGAEPDIGTTGIWFVNDSADATKRSGELISKNKALLFSILF